MNRWRFLALSLIALPALAQQIAPAASSGTLVVMAESDGNGPVDASLRAIESQVKSGSELLLFSVNAITTGTESQGEVTVRLSRSGRIVNGVGADPDIIAASAKAYLNALNKLYSGVERLNPQTSLAP